jgi:hypothetical protein
MNFSELKNFIQTYDNIVDGDVCDQLIDKFESHSNKTIRNQSPMLFDEVNLVREEWPIVQELQGLIQSCASSYRYQLNLDFAIPTKFGIEQFRMKRYHSNQGHFDTHVDITDYSSARRFLAFLIYLNEGEGGDTDFIDMSGEIFHTVKRKRGTVLVFPPMWMFKHRGNKPIDSTKYIISSYFHYL